MKARADLGLLALALGALLIGCRATPAERSPGAEALGAALPETFAFAPPGAVIAEGPLWQAFDDGALAPLIAEALEANHSLAAAAARLEGALAVARQSSGARAPSLSAGLDGARQRQVFVGLPLPGGPISTTSNSFGLSLNVSWELDLWGRLASAAAAAGAEAEASHQDLLAARESLAAQVAKTWFAASAGRRLEDLAESTAQSRGETLESARERLRLGLGRALEVHQAEAELSAARALVAERRLEREAAERQLEVLLGRYPAGELRAARELPDLSDGLPPAVPAGLLARRPDLAALERRLAAADARFAAARADRYPRLSLSAAAGTRSDRPGDLFDPDLRFWSLAGNLVQPIFEGGRLRARVAEADAGRRELFESFAQAVLDACLEVELALASDTLLARRERHLTQALAGAREAERALVERYRRGLVELFELQAAQRQTLELETRTIEARRRRLDARIDLHLAVGGALPRPSPNPDASAPPAP